MAKKRSMAKKKLKPEVVKPTAAKVEVTIKKEALGEAPEEYQFILSDGEKLKNMFDLAKALHKMSDDMFEHHVSKEKNDFGNWIKDVFKLPDFAKEFSAMHNRMEAEVCVLRKLINEMKGGKE